MGLDIKLAKEQVKSCLFRSYIDGASGITANEEDVLAGVFLDHLKRFPELFKGLFYVEESGIPSEQQLTHCALGIDAGQGQILLLQRVFMHEDDVRDAQGRPYRP